MSQTPEDVTSMLVQWEKGDREALDRLMPVVYDELHRMAERYVRRERSDNTLQPLIAVNSIFWRWIRHSKNSPVRSAAEPNSRG